MFFAAQVLLALNLQANLIYPLFAGILSNLDWLFFTKQIGETFWQWADE